MRRDVPIDGGQMLRLFSPAVVLHLHLGELVVLR